MASNAFRADHDHAYMVPETRYLAQMQVYQQVQLLPPRLGRSPVCSSHAVSILRLLTLTNVLDLDKMSLCE